MLMMKCAGLKPGDEVLSNAFTFGAVPSAIEHAGGKVSQSEHESNERSEFDESCEPSEFDESCEPSEFDLVELPPRLIL